MLTLRAHQQGLIDPVVGGMALEPRILVEIYAEGQNYIAKNRLSQLCIGERPLADPQKRRLIEKESEGVGDLLSR